MRTWLPLFAAAILFCALPSRSLAWQVISNIAFPSPGAPGGTQVMDLYLPSSGVPTAGYTVVILHGGSYYTGDKSDAAWLCAMLADQGFAAITSNYTLVTPAMVSAGQGSFPQPINDALNLVHWIRTDGEVLGLPNAVVMSGISAGATVALNAAFAQGHPYFHPLPAPEHRGYTIDGSIGVLGRYDMVWNVYAGGMYSSVAQYIGLGWWQSGWNILYAQASSTNYVDACSPPAVLFEGSVDTLVPAGNSYRLAQAMQAAGAPVQLHIVPGYDHNAAVIGTTGPVQIATYLNAIAWIRAHAQGECGRNAPVTPPAPPGPIGTCCTPDGRCFLIESANCGVGTPGVAGVAGAAVALWGPATTCPSGQCLPGACCVSAGACSAILQSACTGDFFSQASCSAALCQQPLGACCYSSGACSSLFQSACPSGWRGAGTSCAPNPCPQPGACCASSGACAFVQHVACQVSFLPNASCEPNPCPQQSGACCMGSVCRLRTVETCMGPNTNFAGVGSICNLPGDRAHPCCAADFDKNTAVNVVDIFRYLGSWFEGDPDADCGDPPDHPPVVADIFAFLSAWFRGC